MQTRLNTTTSGASRKGVKEARHDDDQFDFEDEIDDDAEADEPAPLPMKRRLPASSPRKRLSVYLPRELALKLQHRCVDAGVPVSEGVRQAVERALQTKDRA